MSDLVTRLSVLAEDDGDRYPAHVKKLAEAAASRIAALEAQLAALSAENERLASERDYWQSQHDERTRQLGQAADEALSRTGAVKVPSGEIQEIVSDLEYWSERLADMRQPQGQSSLKHAASILSALEPAAAEGPQEPVAFRWRNTIDPTMWNVGFAHQAPSYAELEPLYTRPAEQAVTEAEHE